MISYVVINILESMEDQVLSSIFNEEMSANQTTVLGDFLSVV